MKFKYKLHLSALVIFIFVSLLCSVFMYAINFFTEDYFCFSKENASYNDIFYEPKSKEHEIYGIGVFDYLAFKELKTDPDLIDFYNDMDIRVFDEKTINEMMSLLRDCTFKYIDRSDAFYILCKLNKSKAITSLSLSLDWFSKESSSFSQILLDEVNNQQIGACGASIYKVGENVYLVADMVVEVKYNSYLEYEQPSFGVTQRCVFEILPSTASLEIVERKNDFYVYKDYYYEEYLINIIDIFVGVIVAAIYVKKRQSVDGTEEHR